MIDGQHDTDADNVLDGLRKLAASDPRSARAELTTLLDGKHDDAISLLTRLDTPRDGRLRHLVARVAPESGLNVSIRPFLKKWFISETDEFARRAISVALRQLEAMVPLEEVPDNSALLYPEHLAETYDYVVSRLKHKLNNGIMRAQSHLLNLTNELRHSAPNGTVGTSIGELNKELRRLGIALEAIDVDPKHFEWQVITLLPWLKEMSGRYASQYSHIDIQFEGDLNLPVIVDASDYLLETIFWNTWLNAHAAARNPCRIVLRVRRCGRSVKLLVVDNGPGFPEMVRDGAFQEPVSTHGPNRGRGLLEINDAMRRLHGSVCLADDGSGTIRMLFEFPVPQS